MRDYCPRGGWAAKGTREASCRCMHAYCLRCGYYTSVSLHYMLPRLLSSLLFPP